MITLSGKVLENDTIKKQIVSLNDPTFSRSLFDFEAVSDNPLTNRVHEAIEEIKFNGPTEKIGFFYAEWVQ